jgi:Lon protease-like protein
MSKPTAPLLPLRDIIVFPHQVVPLFVGRDKSIAALQEAIRVDKEVVLAAQTKAKTNEPGPDDIFPVGTLGHIVQLLHLPDGTVKVIVEGKQRVRLGRVPLAGSVPVGGGRAPRRAGRAERPRRRGADALGARHVRHVREAQQAHPARHTDRRGAAGVGSALGRHHRGLPDAEARRQAGPARSCCRRARASSACTS